MSGCPAEMRSQRPSFRCRLTHFLRAHSARGPSQRLQSGLHPEFPPRPAARQRFRSASHGFKQAGMTFITRRLSIDTSTIVAAPDPDSALAEWLKLAVAVVRTGERKSSVVAPESKDVAGVCIRKAHGRIGSADRARQARRRASDWGARAKSGASARCFRPSRSARWSAETAQRSGGS